VQDKERKPDWMKRPPVPGGEKYLAIKEKLRELKLHTVSVLCVYSCVHPCAVFA